MPVSSSRRCTCPLPGITRKSHPCSAHSSWARSTARKPVESMNVKPAQVELDGADTLAAQAEYQRFQPRGHREVQLAAQQKRMTAVTHALLNFKTGLTPCKASPELSNPRVVQPGSASWLCSGSWLCSAHDFARAPSRGRRSSGICARRLACALARRTRRACRWAKG